MRRIAAALSLLALAACGGPSEEDILTEDKIRASQSAPELPDIQLSENPEPEPAPPPPEPEVNALENVVEDNASLLGVPGSIPPAFHALWGVEPADCRRGAVVGSAMLVGPDSLTFSDATVSLQGVLADSPGRFAGRFADDAGYEQREELTVGSSGNVLTRSSGGQRIVYRRCGGA
ncbi:hypothetical protein [Sphingomonas xanthus]|uniref:Lipoprotein n=1 Tax=Sphingomonas xanthus TaxID=2594473 RepID=A0A516ISZ3_9SPHN|nr:hypothetical protein [Sphingomonas xanthus]QDP19990.1 hypothetical protein FMM02_08495 [Sphingomonas xanthus]